MTDTEKNSAVVYCGPGIKKYGLTRFAIFKNGYPANVQKAIDEVEEVGKMMVPVSKLGEYRKKIQQAGTEPHRLYHQIARERKGK